jgi:hypothetical protein
MLRPSSLDSTSGLVHQSLTVRQNFPPRLVLPHHQLGGIGVVLCRSIELASASAQGTVDVGILKGETARKGRTAEMPHADNWLRRLIAP